MIGSFFAYLTPVTTRPAQQRHSVDQASGSDEPRDAFEGLCSVALDSRIVRWN